MHLAKDVDNTHNCSPAIPKKGKINLETKNKKLHPSLAMQEGNKFCSSRQLVVQPGKALGRGKGVEKPRDAVEESGPEVTCVSPSGCPGPAQGNGSFLTGSSASFHY